MSENELNRRSFLASMALSAGALSLPGLSGAEQASLSRDLRLEVLTNQLGYPVESAGRCAVPADTGGTFRLINASTGKVAQEGRLNVKDGDFSTFSVGTFEAGSRPGTYYIKAGKRRSYPFHITDRPHEQVLTKILNYFATQRCGSSTTGYCSPCHLDDGIRMDNGEHQDVTGGWHDASDLRKWVGATIYGVIGLARVARLKDGWRRDRIMDEVRWGNKYFLAMQEPDGYVMSHVGGDALQHGDSNRWTNNKIEEAGDELVTITPPGDPEAPEMSVFRPADDRVIDTDPVDTYAQFNFVRAQALVAQLCADRDPDYARRCTEAAEKCWAWTMENRSVERAGHCGTAALAAVQLHGATGDNQYKKNAVELGRSLLELQMDDKVGDDPSITGFFRHRPGTDRAHRDVWHGRTPFLALCSLASSYPDHPDASRWKDGIRRYAAGYLLPIARQNCFGMVPLGLYSGTDPAGRTVGSYSYRYFMRPRNWWVGVNSHVAAAGIGLCEAARLLDEGELMNLAQRQMDWILGFNPLHASTVVGVGHNHPGRFVNSQAFDPPTPQIPGAVMNGIGGNAEDQPVRGDGWYHTAEYWTPMVGHTAWLLAALEARGSF